MNRSYEAMPGGDRVRKGIEDLGRGAVSVEALLVSIGAARIDRAGVPVPAPLPDPEHRLYLHLAQVHGDDAHSRYNALIRKLVSFERALECANTLSKTMIAERSSEPSVTSP
jgi:hypothetical protein